MKSTTVGIDLAAGAERTAAAVVEWSETGATVRELEVGVSDDRVLELMRGPAEKVGIDCPFGWPVAFVDFVSRHACGSAPVLKDMEKGWRRPYVLRRTDVFVHEQTRITPLSVSADKIGHVALRCAELMAVAASSGVDCGKDGSGKLAEVYPAAALKIWGLAHQRYKGRTNADALRALVVRLRDLPWLDLGEYEGVCCESDHALDAVISALVARAVVVGATKPPTDVSLASREGWIHLPTCGLEDLHRRSTAASIS